MTAAIAREMIAVEILKLRRRRGAMAAALGLSVGMVVFYLTVVALRNGGRLDPTRAVLDGSTMLGMYFGSFAAILIGTEAGTADVTSGVFRDLAATGRSRTWLFLVRVPGAVAVALAGTLAGFAVAVAAALVFGGPGPAPGATLVVRCGAWLIAATTVVTVLAVGIASLTGSRTLTLVSVIGWQTLGTTMLYAATFLGSLRDGALLVALSRLRPGPDTGTREIPGSLNALPGYELPMTAVAAVLVLLVWLVVPIGLGAWGARRIDA